MKNRTISQFINYLNTLIKSDQVLNNFKVEAKDFTRNRVISFVDIIFILIGRVTKTTMVELVQFFSSNGTLKICSPQAFSKAKLKINPAVFQFLNQEILDFYYEKKRNTFYKNKYQLLAVDGSMIQLPDSNELGEIFIRTKNQNGAGMPLARASVLYDLNNDLALDALITHNKHSEVSLFYEHIENSSHLIDNHIVEPVIILDRGYANINIIESILKNKMLFLIRTKASLNKEVIEFVNSNVIDNTIIFKRKDRDNISCRIVKVKLKSGEIEYLLTNTEFSIIELKELYYKRWGVETYYGYIKSSLQLENFSSKSANGVLLEFYASIFLANLNQVLIIETALKNDQKNKYEYKINKNIATGIFKSFYIKMRMYKRVPKKIIDDTLTLIRRSKVPIKMERSFERIKNKRSRRKCHFNRKLAI
ncbi:IS4 family transposase [Flammeovirga kamogawensis]|uniref:IS4 family transposase n=1 Tax=Flammeovirga kamogawensis TaxID=373891 RepID=A0ABX8H213_9BACT|nr:IS4 family transposase [Flammeovirga kamogawensis]MBB6460132.1 hypothetical protein [Flammeovirga kamogawensis]QWG09946.1 IS4 family transposase [Flammeovirga kamogawensis]TRX65454.1 IS4 family transposase [Flammeovirga kamogawensis]